MSNNEDREVNHTEAKERLAFEAKMEKHDKMIAARKARIEKEIEETIAIINFELDGYAWTRQGETPEMSAFDLFDDRDIYSDDELREVTEVYIALRKARKEEKAPDIAVLKKLDVLEPRCLKDDGCGGLELVA